MDSLKAVPFTADFHQLGWATRPCLLRLMAKGVVVSSWVQLHGSQVSKAGPHGTPGHPSISRLDLLPGACALSQAHSRNESAFNAPATILESLRRPNAGALPRLQTSFAAASVFGVAFASFARQTHVPMLALDRASPNARPEPPPPRELRTVGVCARNRQSRFESRIRQKVLAAPCRKVSAPPENISFQYIVT